MAFADEDGLQPRRKPKEYRVRDHELDQLAERDDWTLNRNFPATIAAAGLTLAVEGFVLDGFMSGRAAVGALIAVAGGLWFAWATNQEPPRQRLVQQIKAEAEELRKRHLKDLADGKGVLQANLPRRLAPQRRAEPQMTRVAAAPRSAHRPPTK